jgi:hypothetical protein
MTELPRDWSAALQAATEARRVMVIGASDVGKSGFARSLLSGRGGRALVDLDPGQKMIGPPGTVGIGAVLDDGSMALEQFMFTGSTSPGHLREFLAATRRLLHGRRRRFVVNTSGHVHGVGIRVQALTVEAVRPDLVVAIADGTELDPILVGLGGIPVERIQPLPDARRKGPRERRRARQQAFAAALDGAIPQTLPPDIPFQPAQPATFAGPSRPVCAISDPSEREVCIGVLQHVDAERIIVFAPKLRSPAAEITLGRMWTRPTGLGWRLIESAQPSWNERPSGEGSDRYLPVNVRGPDREAPR